MKNFLKLVGYTVLAFVLIVGVFLGIETLLGRDIATALSQDIVYGVIGFLVLCVIAFILSLF